MQWFMEARLGFQKLETFPSEDKGDILPKRPSG